MKKYIIEFRIVGTGPVPPDMLRYDCAWPATSDDAASLNAYVSEWPGNREILLHACKQGGKHAAKPTAARWASFGWTVIANRVIG